MKQSVFMLIAAVFVFLPAIRRLWLFPDSGQRISTKFLRRLIRI
jgi:hypothetical protein